MANYVIYDSGDQGWLNLGLSTCGTNATSFAAANSYTAIGAGCLNDLRAALDGLVAGGTKLDNLLFTTHGIPGCIIFGKSTVNEGLANSNVAAWLAGRGYEGLFNPGAVVSLDGCNVAEGPDGSTFLQNLGAIFFIAIYGSIKASTTLGFRVGATGVAHPFDSIWGNTKTEYYAPGPRLLEEFVQ